MWKPGNEAKQLQESAPPKDVEPPKDLAIAVVVDGSAASSSRTW
jgi:hypothetical protein